jgi:hypothetical protein
VKEKNLKKGELIAQHSGPVSILKWNDKKDIIVIGRKLKMANKMWTRQGKSLYSVLGYDENMGGVDLKDLQPFLLQRGKND